MIGLFNTIAVVFGIAFALAGIALFLLGFFGKPKVQKTAMKDSGDAKKSKKGSLLGKSFSILSLALLALIVFFLGNKAYKIIKDPQSLHGWERVQTIELFKPTYYTEKEKGWQLITKNGKLPAGEYEIIAHGEFNCRSPFSPFIERSKRIGPSGRGFAGAGWGEFSKEFRQFEKYLPLYDDPNVNNIGMLVAKINDTIIPIGFKTKMKVEKDFDLRLSVNLPHNYSHKGRSPSEVFTRNSGGFRIEILRKK